MSETRTDISSEARALAVQKIMISVLARAQGLDPELRTLVAQVLHDAAVQLEREAKEVRNTPHLRSTSQGALEAVEAISEAVLGSPPTSKSRRN